MSKPITQPPWPGALHNLLPIGSYIDSNNQIIVTEPLLVASEMRHLAQEANFGHPDRQTWAAWLIRELAWMCGVYPASIHCLYRAIGHHTVRNAFTVPAINLRTLTFDLAFVAFQKAVLLKAGAIIFEIARSEIGYTDQTPAQYASCILAAAIAAGYKGPVFIQGDHYQVSAKSYADDPDREIGDLTALIKASIAAGFLNIDVDTSTLVNIDAPGLDAQQLENARVCARLLDVIRRAQPAGVIVSVGGEIGEVATTRELDAFMRQLWAAQLANNTWNAPGLSKISIQTGTRHGGVMLPDGAMDDVAVDFKTLWRLGRRARRYGFGGAVQHGASTLPIDAFWRIREAGALETHLATALQRSVLDSLVADMHDDMWEWLYDRKGDQQKVGETEIQFWYRLAKHTLGPFKGQLWNLSPEVRQEAVAVVGSQLFNIFTAFNIAGTAELVRRYAPPVRIPNLRPDEVEEAIRAEIRSGAAAIHFNAAVPSDLAD